MKQGSVFMQIFLQVNSCDKNLFSSCAITSPNRVLVVFCCVVSFCCCWVCLVSFYFYWGEVGICWGLLLLLLQVVDSGFFCFLGLFQFFT